MKGAGCRGDGVVTNPAVAVEDEVIACLLSEREFAIRGKDLAGGLFTAVEEITELPDGYADRFANDGHLSALPEFITAEHRCGPFLTFEIAFAPHAAPLWPRLRGAPGATTFVADTASG